MRFLHQQEKHFFLILITSYLPCVYWQKTKHVSTLYYKVQTCIERRWYHIDQEFHFWKYFCTISKCSPIVKFLPNHIFHPFTNSAYLRKNVVERSLVKTYQDFYHLLWTLLWGISQNYDLRNSTINKMKCCNKTWAGWDKRMLAASP